MYAILVSGYRECSKCIEQIGKMHLKHIVVHTQ